MLRLPGARVAVRSIPGRVLPVLLLTATLSCAHEPPAAHLSDVEYEILKVCEGIVRLYERHHGDIWPGYSLAERPFLVYVRDKWALLLNAGGGAEGFGPSPEGWPGLGTNALLHRGPYGDLVGQLAFDLPIDGMKTLALGFPEEFPPSTGNPEAEAFGTIVHEAFHQYQHEAFGDIARAREERYPVHDPENSALVYLEMRTLMDAVESMTSGDRDRLRADVERFVAARRHRWARAKPFVSRYEQGQEIREGTAKDVETKSIELFADLEYGSSLEGLTRPLSESFTSVSMPELLLADFRDRMA